MSEYAAVVRSLAPVVDQGKSLDSSWDPNATPLAKEITYGVLRNWWHLDEVVSNLISKPLTKKNLDVKLLIIAAIYSVDHIRRPEYASVNAAVETTGALGKTWAKGLVNGVLRNYLRSRDSLGPTSDLAKTNHPAWLAKAIRETWPESADEIFKANNTHAPMTLRVNSSRISLNDYIKALENVGIDAHPGKYANTALYLKEPVATEKLPGFAEGHASIQDEASQLAATVLAPTDGERILDACAAPGGKTCHILETAPGAALTAIDVDEGRLRQVRQNLKRLGLECELQVANLTSFTTSEKFDRILLDVPCSATGIIRRHPDIKLSRRESDIAKLVSAQTELLQAAWQLLKPGGTLVYSTCSILPAENEGVVSQFMTSTRDASRLPIDAKWGTERVRGRQLLPTIESHDGFYYARLSKVRE